MNPPSFLAMSRLHKLVLTLVILVASAFSPVVAADPPLTVAISVPLRNGERLIENYFKKGHFYVVLTNVSAKPVRLWREEYSWGYSCLYFEITDATGKKRLAHKAESEWSKNFPDYHDLAPGDTWVMDVQFADATVWNGFSIPSGSQNVTLRAVYAIKPDNETREFGVWTGKIASAEGKFTISD